ncbi:MAG: hypothetical protein SGILL_005994 [Bacillariaceae sp.]
MTVVADDGKHFELEVSISEIFTDPFYIHQMLAKQYGRVFSEDSSMKYNFEDASTHMKNKKAVFRLGLEFPCQKKVADDMGHPGKLYKTIVKKDKKLGKNIKVPVMVIELKSLYQIEEEDNEDETLKTDEFVAPEKGPAVKGKTAQVAMMLEFLFEKGISLDDVKKEMKRNGLADSDDVNAMDIDTAFQEHAAKKNKRTA